MLKCSFSYMLYRLYTYASYVYPFRYFFKYVKYLSIFISIFIFYLLYYFYFLFFYLNLKITFLSHVICILGWPLFPPAGNSLDSLGILIGWLTPEETRTPAQYFGHVLGDFTLRTCTCLHNQRIRYPFILRLLKRQKRKSTNSKVLGKLTLKLTLESKIHIG